MSPCRSVRISDAAYYNWRKTFGGVGWSQLSEMKSLENENARQALAVIVRTKMGADDVLEALYPLLLRRGTPE